jgi:hypothetical protein
VNKVVVFFVCIAYYVITSKGKGVVYGGVSADIVLSKKNWEKPKREQKGNYEIN